jgi:nicotinamidase-related amidase
MHIEFLIIDPQNDFSDVPHAALPIPGASEDAERLALLLDRLHSKIENIHVTLDTHQLVDISHPVFWYNQQGKRPVPFTKINVEDVENGHWRVYEPQFQHRALEYVRTLRENGRYDLTIWPPHCLLGTWGHNVIPALSLALRRWEENRLRRVDYLIKGNNPWTEHYSAVQAAVQDPNDPTTKTNTILIDALERADIVVLSGQALSHCVANTIRDIVTYSGQNSIYKLVLLEDTSSPIPGFENLASQFLIDMRNRGMKTVCTSDFSY